MISILIKQPAEITRVPVFAGMAIVPPVTTSVVARGLLPGAAALTATAQLAIGAVSVSVSGGSDGERYLVTVQATDAAGAVHEAELEIAVVDGAWVMPDGGVAYISIIEFVKMFGLEEVVRMTDDRSGRIDRDMLIGALQAAQGIANGNLGVLYAVPIAAVPDLVKTAIADIARARLYPAGVPDGVSTNAKEGLRTLERIASGALKLALPSGEAATPAESPAPVLIAPGRRAYPDGRGLDVVSGAFDIAIDVGENVTAALDEAARRGADMTPAMGEISRYMVSQIGERFRTETGPDGVPWKKSLRVTGYTDAQGNRVEGDGGQTLTLKGDLRRSMREDFGADYAAAGPEASGGAGVYARIHQEGGKIVPKALLSGETHLRALNTPFGLRSSVTIPARPYLGFNEADGVRVVDILGDHMSVPFAGSLEGGV